MQILDVARIKKTVRRFLEVKGAASRIYCLILKGQKNIFELMESLK